MSDEEEKGRVFINSKQKRASRSVRRGLKGKLRKEMRIAERRILTTGAAFEEGRRFERGSEGSENATRSREILVNQRKRET